MLMNSEIIKATFTCSICKDNAAIFYLSGNDVYQSYTLSVSGFIDERCTIISKERFIALKEVFKSEDVQGLYALDKYIAQFYCYDCKSIYCKSHWRVICEVISEYPYEEDSPKGVCPNGHERWFEEKE
jgi:hypothetical protein